MDLFTITASTILSMYLNPSATGDFYYNADINNQQVTSLTVFKTEDSQLFAKWKYDYKYDSDNRLVSKEAWRWDNDNMKWAKDHRIDIAYDNNQRTVERSLWDKRHSTYASPVDKYVYSVTMDNVVAVAKYKWDKSRDDFKMIDKFLVMDPQNNIMASDLKL
jgi:hypothetical protein